MTDEQGQPIRLRATVELEGTTGTGMEVPAAVLAPFGTGKRPAVVVAPGQRKEWVRWVTEAKRAETRTHRLATTVEALAAGRRTR